MALRFCKDATVNIGGRDYKTTQIGNQIWLAENLDYKFAYDGGTLPIGGTDFTVTTPHAWYYNNDEATYGIDGTYKCGLLYNWYAAKYLDDNKTTLLPSGWHIPTIAEWNTLATTLGGASTAGTLLKAINYSITSDFPSNWNGSDNCEFNVISSGYRNYIYGGITDTAVFWTYEESSSSKSNNRFLNTSTNFGADTSNKSDAFSLRLVKDAT